MDDSFMPSKMYPRISNHHDLTKDPQHNVLIYWTLTLVKNLPKMSIFDISFKENLLAFFRSSLFRALGLWFRAKVILGETLFRAKRLPLRFRVAFAENSIVYNRLRKFCCWFKNNKGSILPVLFQNSSQNFFRNKMAVLFRSIFKFFTFVK